MYAAELFGNEYSYLLSHSFGFHCLAYDKNSTVGVVLLSGAEWMKVVVISVGVQFSMIFALFLDTSSNVVIIKKLNHYTKISNGLL